MKYKIGDKVRILDGRSDNTVLTLWTPSMTKAIGTIGTVLKIDEWDNTVLVAIGEDMDAYWMQGNWLAPVEEKKPYPKRIYKGDGKTVVMWEDGTKTIVKRAEGEPDNDYAAFTAALAIKVYGDNSKVNRIVHMTETVEKRKKAKKKKQAGCFEVIKEAGGNATMDAPEVVETFDEYATAKKFAAMLNGVTTTAFGTYYVRERERSHAAEEEQ